MKGIFITFEGCEGVGKSRQTEMLKEYLDARGVKYYFTREPGGTPVSEKIRELILDKNNSEMTDECEALLYAAARAQLLKQVVMPRLEKGELVLCDRFVDSSLAYQGYARGLGADFVKSINAFAFNGCMPDYTVFLKLPPEMAFKRKGGVDGNDRLELSGSDFHERVYRGYLKLVEEYPKRFIVIDASGSKEQTHEKIIAELKKRGVIKE